MKILMVIPTYNESENIGLLIKRIFDAFSSSHLSNGKEYTPEILIVDDNSPDGTAEIVKTMSNTYPDKLHIISREGKQGCASAYLKGFSWGMENNYDLLLAMDGDFSHDPKYIPQMLDAIKDNDMVVGSRNIKGGKIENRSWIRNAFTKCAALYCRVILNCPIRDITGGYNLYKRKVFEKINMSKIQCRGYSFQIDIKYQAFVMGLKIVEIPIVFPNRKYGKSKMAIKYLFDAIYDVWKIKNKG